MATSWLQRHDNDLEYTKRAVKLDKHLALKVRF
jgi:hypothetical protein